MCDPARSARPASAQLGQATPRGIDSRVAGAGRALLAGSHIPSVRQTVQSAENALNKFRTLDGDRLNNFVGHLLHSLKVPHRLRVPYRKTYDFKTPPVRGEQRHRIAHLAYTLLVDRSRVHVRMRCPKA